MNNTLELTDEQRRALNMVLILTAKYREGEEAASKELGEERGADGTLRFPNMKSNGEWWEKINKAIEEIRTMLEA